MDSDVLDVLNQKLDYGDSLDYGVDYGDSLL